MKKLLKAIYFATEAHLNQTRKDKITPYIEHPLGVALILSRITDKDNIIIAGILHDVIEDTKTTKNQILQNFGSGITQIVLECSEQNKKLDWKTRKESMLKKVKFLSREAALVKSADILHNLFEAVQKVKAEGISYFQNFNTDGITKIKYERRRLEELKKYHGDISLLSEIETYVEFLEKSLDN